MQLFLEENKKINSTYRIDPIRHQKMNLVQLLMLRMFHTLKS